MHCMVIYNVLAFVPILGGFLLGAAGASLGLSQPISMLVGFVAAAGIDVYMRCRSADVAQNNLWDPNAGGHIWFIPIWLCSVLGLAGTIAGALGFIK